MPGRAKWLTLKMLEAHLRPWPQWSLKRAPLASMQL